MATTLNQVLPWGGLDWMKWEHLFQNSDLVAARVHTVICDIISAKSRHLPLSEALDLAADTVRNCVPKIFKQFYERLKSRVQKEWGLALERRLVVRVPSYSKQVLETCLWEIKMCIRGLALSQPLKNWYTQVTAVTTTPLPSVQESCRGGVGNEKQYLSLLKRNATGDWILTQTSPPPYYCTKGLNASS